ncbi:hypothetical protein [Vibrio mediterranei]|uniref:hypothetical protein n=1 Tax=Vibrio mediterranei TaxID=689 RepID=UPI00148C847F|nr:hypothetical protein [Vibrio mediterranei]
MIKAFIKAKESGDTLVVTKGDFEQLSERSKQRVPELLKVEVELISEEEFEAIEEAQER